MDTLGENESNWGLLNWQWKMGLQVGQSQINDGIVVLQMLSLCNSYLKHMNHFGGRGQRLLFMLSCSCDPRGK